MSTTERDAGLIRGLGTWGLAASIVSMIVGAGIFAVPSALAAAVGPYAPLAFLACGIAIGAVAVCFAEGGSRIPTSGGAYGPALAASTSPLADAMGRVGPALRILMLAGAGLSMLGFMGSDILSTPRLLFAFGREGWLPRALGRVHPRTGAPHIALISYAALIILLALTGTFAELAVLAALTMAPLYTLGCIAAWRLARGGVALAGMALNFRWLGIAAIIGIAGMLAMIILVFLLQIRFAPAAA